MDFWVRAGVIFPGFCMLVAALHQTAAIRDPALAAPRTNCWFLLTLWRSARTGPAIEPELRGSKIR